MKIREFFDNNITLYITLGIAIINILAYLSMVTPSCIIILLIAIFVSHQFIDIYAINILFGLFISNIVFGCGAIKEGLI